MTSLGIRCFSTHKHIQYGNQYFYTIQIHIYRPLEQPQSLKRLLQSLPSYTGTPIVWSATPKKKFGLSFYFLSKSWPESCENSLFMGQMIKFDSKDRHGQFFKESPRSCLVSSENYEYNLEH